jgi:hypothetical protein
VFSWTFVLLPVVERDLLCNAIASLLADHFFRYIIAREQCPLGLVVLSRVDVRDLACNAIASSLHVTALDVSSE